MIAPHGHDDGQAREIARGLTTCVRAAIEATRVTSADSSLAWRAAADVAELLQLEGLAALLVACRAHAGAPPLEVAHVLERLERLVLASDVAGDISPFVSADRELAALAGVLDSQEWSAPESGQPPRVAVELLATLLADLELDQPALIERTHVGLPVAAALRAALDWLGAESSGVLRVSVQDAALTLSVRVAHEPGLSPAGAVLALTGGALLPEADGRWSLRMPLHAERPAFLLARQGQLSLALPWTAVARLRIADATGRAAMPEPSLAPWSPLERSAGERPAALIAQGLQRAWLHLDHIVWRVFARPESAHAPAEVPGGRAVVRTEEGESFWVVDPLEALAGVPELHTPPAGLRARHAESAVTREHGSDEAVARADENASATAAPAMEPVPAEGSMPALSQERENAPAEPGRDERATAAVLPAPNVAPPRLVVLGPSDVRPLSRPRSRASQPEMTIVTPAPRAATVAPAATPIVVAPVLPTVVAPTAAPPPEPVPPASERVTAVPAGFAPVAHPRPRRALVVDDSLVARMGLARVLEREGWLVEGAETAAEMWAALEDGEWSAVFVDVSLPDASGRAHLRQLVARQLVTAERFELVALTRDGSEIDLVRGTGITRLLRKPFAPGAVESLVRDLPRSGNAS